MADDDKKRDEQEGLETEAVNETLPETEQEIQSGEDVTEDEVCAEEDILEKLTSENADLKDQILRKTADFDNYRKRMLREKQEIYDYANTALLTDLIAVLDDFDRALVAGVDKEGNSVSDLRPIVDGIKMINKQMHGLLEAKYNLNVYGEVGDLFNHDIHEAIATTKGAVAHGICSEVYLRGYMLKERVIRPAKVSVTMPDGTVSEDEEDKK